jgi:membrane protease YdiL (CAAX protease family)
VDDEDNQGRKKIVPVQVRHDYVSLSFVMVAMVIFFYTSTWSGDMQVKALIGAILLIGGLTMSFFLKFTSVGQFTNKIALYSVLAFAAIMATNFIVSIAPAMESTVAEPVSWALFSVLIAISEEQFFRGLVTPYLATSLGVPVGCLLAGLVFGIFHFAVYGTSMNALFVVTISGVILSYIAVSTMSITPGMIAHSANNFISSMGISLSGSILAPAMGAWQYAYLGALLSVTAFVIIRKRRNLQLT